VEVLADPVTFSHRDGPGSGPVDHAHQVQVRDYAATIGSIEAPVLLIQGEQDKVLSPAGARKVAADNPHWDYESLPGVGHAPMLEVPEQLADSIKAWADQRLARPSRAPRPSPVT
jgi:pimeloyl-ACP methyl ester carboxylesterase